MNTRHHGIVRNSGHIRHSRLIALTALASLAGLAPSNSALAFPPPYVMVIDGKEQPCPDVQMGDPAVVDRIIAESKDNSLVMSYMHSLTFDIGARLTGSAAAEKANNWAMEQYKTMGIDNAHLEQWGTIPVRFDRGPSTGKVLLRKEKPADDDKDDKAPPKVEYEDLRDMQFTTLAWTAGTDGPVRGPVVREPKTQEEFDKVKNSLKGAWVLIQAPPALGQRGVRNLARARHEMRADALSKVAKGTDPATLTIPEQLALQPVAGFISTSRDERVWTGAASNWRDLDADHLPKDVEVIIRLSDYDYINSRLTDHDPIEVEFDLANHFTKGPIPVYNTVAEIRGSQKPDEVVIISAHLDSWNGPGSQGCTDNGTGSVVTLEAARLLMAVHAKPLRTIRFINYTGEEQGLLGSHGYVEAHKSEMDKISAVFVDDGGTNYEGGLPAAENMVQMLAEATAPTNNVFYSDTDKKFMNVNVRNTGKKIDTHGSSDHASFNAVGVPGFFWDEVGRADYPYGWHTQNDRYDLAIPEYLVQSAANAAITAYRLACADTLLPRAVKEPEVKHADSKPEPKQPQGASKDSHAAAPASK
ncbi:MAG: M20/M25/M40 family metallo-hydrolase [Tepidisphaera sp.]|nr:M20/M25/M40 family metallo-hydrolase [Tepidisphaera sp.]